MVGIAVKMPVKVPVSLFEVPFPAAAPDPSFQLMQTPAGSSDGSRNWFVVSHVGDLDAVAGFQG